MCAQASRRIAFFSRGFLDLFIPYCGLGAEGCPICLTSGKPVRGSTIVSGSRDMEAPVCCVGEYVKFYEEGLWLQHSVRAVCFLLVPGQM